MTNIELKILNGDSVTGVIKLERIDDRDELVKRTIRKGVCLSDILNTSSNGQLSMGELEVNLDFDEHGQLVQMEFYT